MSLVLSKVINENIVVHFLYILLDEKCLTIQYTQTGYNGYQKKLKYLSYMKSVNNKAILVLREERPSENGHSRTPDIVCEFGMRKRIVFNCGVHNVYQKHFW